MTKNLKLKMLTLALIFSGLNLFASDFYTQKGDTIILYNGLINRKIVFENNQIKSVSLKMDGDSLDFINKSKEFSFLLNDSSYSGQSNWKLNKTSKIEDKTGGKGLQLELEAIGSVHKFMVELNYLLYPEFPVVRKWATIKNIGDEDLKLEALNVEDLQTTVWQNRSQVYHNYARFRHLGRFVGKWDDPLVVVHDINNRRGIAVGNEAVGVLKRTAYHTRMNDIQAGLTHPGQEFPFRKWLKPGQKWESPKTFLALYTNSMDGNEIVNEDVNHFVKKHLQLRIYELEEKPVFVYNTWNPFRTFLSDTLVAQVAEAAAECGMEELIIDDGWQINVKGVTSEKDWGGNYGDWLVDTFKFKGGLKPAFDNIKRLDMKPGLWVSIGSATKDSKVFKEHPEWFVKNKDGQPGNIHLESHYGNFFSASFGTDWYNYIKETLLRLVNEYGLRYAKLDLAVVTSPYVNDDDISGCHSTENELYRDHHESFIVFYERLLKLFDELHKEAPDLFIDCTYETAGKMHLQDYAFAKHAEGNWLSNFESKFPMGGLSVRHLAWWRTPVMPASSLVIGNLPMDEPEFEFGLKSLIGTLPIVLGDPREMNKEKRAIIRSWADWMKEMQAKHDYMSFRKDLQGYGEPKEGAWDGWQRMNWETKNGGIVGVFKQGGNENKRTVVVKDLIPDSKYLVKEAPSGEIILKASGSQLMETGFSVEIIEDYDGRIFEITKE